MKIKTTVTEIEATVQDLRQSNTLSDAFTEMLRKALIPDCSYDEDDENEQGDGE